MLDNAHRMRSQNFTSFSTTHVPPHERLEYWEAHNAEALIGLDIRPLHDNTLEAQQQNRLSPILRAAKVLGSSQVTERSRAMIRKYPTDSVALFFCTHGESFYSDERETYVLKAGQMLACDADSPFIRGFGVGVSEMVLTVSKEAFNGLSGGKSLTHAQRFNFGGSQSPLPRLAAATKLAKSVDNALSNPTASIEVFEEESLSWLKTLLQDDGQDTTLLFDQALGLIAEHFRNPGFRRTDLSGMLHMSERQVARLFEAQNTSFSRELLRKRIHTAQTFLKSEPHTTIAEIARRCGFRSTAHFSRTFRKILGLSPTEARQHAL